MLQTTLSRGLRIVVCASLLVLAVSAQKVTDSGDMAAAISGASQIAAAQLKSDLEFISAEELHGRGTPSAGLDLTAKFIVTRVSRAGLKPAGENGGWFQTIALSQSRLLPDQTTAEFAGRTFRCGEDFLAESCPFPVTASAGLVYVGDGWVLPAKNHDPYQGLDVRGKFVIYAYVEPPPDSFVGAWMKPREAARKYGARGMISVPSFSDLAMWNMSRARSVLPSVEVSKAPPDEAGGLMEITASPAMLTAMFAREKVRAEQVANAAAARAAIDSFALDPRKELKITVGALQTHPTTSNIIAVVEGSDPKLENEYVVIGAHYDAMPEPELPAYEARPGADDNGSGTAGLLAIAEAMAAAPKPKRSILFIWHTGEEQQGWGSEYFTAHPTVPLGQIVAYINLDMIGRSQMPGAAKQMLPHKLTGPEEVQVEASRSLSSDLAEMVDRVNASYLKLQFDRRDGPSFGGSDHALYIQKEIPSVSYTSGDHADMHSAGDTATKIDYRKLESIARTAYATARALANAPNRPRVDRPPPKS